MNKSFAFVVAGVVFGLALLFSARSDTSMGMEMDQPNEIIREEVPEGLSRAIFAAGCFWCTESAFQETEGVEAAISGYAGGEEFNPSYEQVYKETTTHREAVMIYYDPEIISYDELLDILWRNIDPTDPGGQFVDRGHSYTTAIFYETPEEADTAAESLSQLDASGKFSSPIVTPIIPYTTFYEAEEYHQDFYIKSPDRYKSYEGASGREEYKERVWEQIQLEQS